jgi:hypothetical protein
MKKTFALLVCLLAVVPAAAAEAAAPPAGTYECSYVSSGRLFGLIAFSKGGTYKYNTKTTGRFTTSGHAIKFHTGR